MRGSRIRLIKINEKVGIIPAHAGLTVHKTVENSTKRDHPRACGAHTTATEHDAGAEGSSPRMRGSPVADQHDIIRHGIIPAHAGLTLDVLRRNSKRRDHPRACGAHFYRGPLHFLQGGSSPRMRGSLIEASKHDLKAGIIPAHAGLTAGCQSQFPAPRDHPRACGAHTLRALRNSRNTGSSPRMRGSR